MDTEVPAGDSADLLARAYLDMLARAEGVKNKPMLDARRSDDPVVQLLDDLDGEPSDDAPQLRVDMVVAAVLTAKAIAGEAGLARRLRREGPLVTIATHTADMAPLVGTIIDECATGGHRRKVTFVRDGTEKSHNNDRGNAEIINSINKRYLIVGVAADPKRHLPRALMRMTEYRLTLPALDEWALRLTIEALTGRTDIGTIDPALVRAADITDLGLAIRAGLSPQECLDRLDQVVRTKNEHLHSGPALEELAGYAEAKDWGLALAQDLADYRAGRIAWDQIDNTALLLSGPPGTGKTTFASALAKSAGVHLVKTSVADWNAASYLSGTLQAIKDAFGQARRNAPSILFIDEADGISDRNTLSGEHREYWVQIVNTLLENLSGTAENEGVVVIAATNYPERIDLALRRAQRLDREIRLEKPGVDDLALIFRHHVTEAVLPGVDLKPLALAARGCTGADVESFVRRAKGVARRAGRDLDIEDVLMQIRGGRSPLDAETRSRVAAHEAGHVVVAKILEVGHFRGVSVHDSGGVAEFDDVLDGSLTPAQLDDVIAVTLAGRVAERFLLGDVAWGSSRGSESDLAKASRMAEEVEARSGAGHLGNVYLPDGLIGLSLVPGFLDAVRARLDRAETRACEILTGNVVSLRHISEALETRGYLSPNEVDDIFGGDDGSAPLNQEAAE
jgi:SpoVK/Ycf46/Vps4 family AAA+-type ATPase